MFLYFKLSSCPNSLEACQLASVPLTVNIQTNRKMKLDGNARLIMEAIISVWLCQPIASSRNEELELPSLIVDNTRHVTQLSAIRF